METLREKTCRCGVELTGRKKKYCSKSCSNHYGVGDLRKRHKDKVDQIKVEKGCSRCGYNASPLALHFNHLDPKAKYFGIGDSLTRKWELIEAEINKCEILCANCHAIHSHKEGHYYTGMGRLRT